MAGSASNLIPGKYQMTDSENFEGVGVREGRIDVKFAPRAPELDDDPEALRARLDLAVALVVACGYPPAYQVR